MVLLVYSSVLSSFFSIRRRRSCCRGGVYCLGRPCEAPSAAGEQPVNEPDDQREHEDAPEEYQGPEEAESHHGNHGKSTKTTMEATTKPKSEIALRHSTWTKVIE